ncbi:DNA polymerase III subunit delta' [Tropicimonas sp.]|uniref:DNA polymerase III subunit delta' n=1 Tax=Tropicimonas sp. TaxID=2067044 RepID=UPI003A8933CF
MSDAGDIPEPDRQPGASHPRETAALFGQEEAESAFLDACNAGRLHHAWLISGPRGVGKATLAWRIARFLLATPDTKDGLFGVPEPPRTLDIDPNNPVARRVAALSEPRLFLLRRPWDSKARRLRAEITVDEARRLKGFFALSSTDGGRRVVIVDSADELNPSAANAVLKLLEEPPARTVLLLVSHQPSRLLATIRSRCRTLRCRTLGVDDMQGALSAAGLDLPEGAGPLAALSGGSVGEAYMLTSEGGLEFYAALVSLVGRAPGINRPAMLQFVERYGARGEAIGIERALHIADLFLSRLARTGVAGPPLPEATPGEAALLQRLCPDACAARYWAGVQQRQGARVRQGISVNLDPAALLLDTVLTIDAGAGQAAPAPA